MFLQSQKQLRVNFEIELTEKVMYFNVRLYCVKIASVHYLNGKQNEFIVYGFKKVPINWIKIGVC